MHQIEFVLVQLHGAYAELFSKSDPHLLIKHLSPNLNKPQLLLNLRESTPSDVGRLLGSFFHLGFKSRLVGHEGLEFVLNGSKSVCTDLADGELEVAVAATVKLAFDLVKSLSREDRVDRHEVVDAVLPLGVSHRGVGVDEESDGSSFEV